MGGVEAPRIEQPLPGLEAMVSSADFIRRLKRRQGDNKTLQVLAQCSLTKCGVSLDKLSSQRKKRWRKVWIEV